MTGAILAKAKSGRLTRISFRGCKEGAMDLAVWLPSLFLLGIVGIAAMFAFIAACERV
jgi:hypothetical protein